MGWFEKLEGYKQQCFAAEIKWSRQGMLVLLKALKVMIASVLEVNWFKRRKNQPHFSIEIRRPF